jgi:lipoprotein-anchoring transpeptidase ErfK/SrfK
MKALNALSAIYLLGASAFGVAIALQRNPEWGEAANRLGQAAWPVVKQGFDVADETALKPAARQLIAWDKQFFDAIDPPMHVAVARAKPHPKIAGHEKAHPHPVVVVARAAPPPVLRPTILEAEKAPPKAKAPEAAPSFAPPVAVNPSLQQAPAASAPAPRPDLTAPSSTELAHVMVRLKDNLTVEMLQNFELFLYVSKAEAGPWSQRMYVFRKQANGDLAMLYNWPVSTGREQVEFTPGGQRAPSFTPQGYYQLDPSRIYKHHTSGQWGSPMPYAMFFSWEQHGMQTGLAIHGATGEDIAQLGHRASAGCVRLSPENAALLFNLIKADYRGLAPRFAYDRRTATMSNDGLLMHDAQGKLQYADGYKVLVFIENYGGENVVAALF